MLRAISNREQILKIKDYLLFFLFGLFLAFFSLAWLQQLRLKEQKVILDMYNMLSNVDLACGDEVIASQVNRRLGR